MDLSISVWHAYVVLFFNKIINDFFSLTVCVKAHVKLKKKQYRMYSLQPMDVYACGCNAKPLVDDNPNGFHRFRTGSVDVDDRGAVTAATTTMTMCGYKIALTTHRHTDVMAKRYCDNNVIVKCVLAN